MVGLVANGESPDDGHLNGAAQRVTFHMVAWTEWIQRQFLNKTGERRTGGGALGA